MTAPVNSRDIILQISSDRGAYPVISWEDILDRPISGGFNLINNSDFATGDFTNWIPWTNPTYSTVVPNTDTTVPASAPSRNVAKITPTGSTGIVSVFAANLAYTQPGAELEGFGVSPGQQYHLSIQAVKSSGFAATYFSCTAWYLLQDGTYDTNNVILPLISVVTTTWAEYTAAFLVPADAVRCWIYITSNPTAGNAFYTKLIVNRKAPTEYIVDGAITAEKISVTNLQAVSAEMGQLNMTGAGHIKGGQTAFNTGTGFWMGYSDSGAVYKFSFGTSTVGITWDGSVLRIKGGGLDVGTDGYVRGGKTSYADTTAGFFLGYDSSAYKLKIGTSTKYITWNGSDLSITGNAIISGSLVADQIESGGLSTVYSASATGTDACSVSSITIPSGCRSIVVTGFFSVAQTATWSGVSSNPKDVGGSVVSYTWTPCYGTISSARSGGATNSNTGYGSSGLTLLDPVAGTYTFSSVRGTSYSAYGGTNVLIVQIQRR